MRRHRFRGIRPRRRGPSINGVVWMIGLAVLFYTDWWWPGILVLAGISFLLSAGWQGSTEPEPELPGDEPPLSGMEPDNPAEVFRPAPIVTPPPAPAPTPRTDLLPNTCPQCGAPVRSGEVRWTGAHSAACSYCGSNIPALKSKPG